MSSLQASTSQRCAGYDGSVPNHANAKIVKSAAELHKRIFQYLVTFLEWERFHKPWLCLDSSLPLKFGNCTEKILENIFPLLQEERKQLLSEHMALFQVQSLRLCISPFIESYPQLCGVGVMSHERDEVQGDWVAIKVMLCMKQNLYPTNTQWSYLNMLGCLHWGMNKNLFLKSSINASLMTW